MTRNHTRRFPNHGKKGPLPRGVYGCVNTAGFRTQVRDKKILGNDIGWLGWFPTIRTAMEAYAGRKLELGHWDLRRARAYMDTVDLYKKYEKTYE